MVTLKICCNARVNWLLVTLLLHWSHFPIFYESGYVLAENIFEFLQIETLLVVPAEFVSRNIEFRRSLHR